MGDILALWVSKVEFNEDNNFSKILIITSLGSKYNSVCPMKAFLFIKSQAAVGQSPQENGHHQRRGERRTTRGLVRLYGRGLLPPGDADVDGGGRDGLHAGHDAGVLAGVLTAGPGEVEPGLEGAVTAVVHLDPGNTTSC